MKASRIIIILGLAFQFTFSQADFQGVATYESKTTIDMATLTGRGGRQLSEAEKKQFAERLRRNLEKTYTLRFNKSESVYTEQAKLEAPTAGNQQGRRGGFGNNFSPGDQYKSVKTGELIQEQEFFGKKFIIKDTLPKLNWKMENETRQIGKYTCFKATAIKNVESRDFRNFFRRGRSNADAKKDSAKAAPKNDKLIKTKQVVVTAWYTPQIPVNQGPGEYYGLPGLIIELNEDRTTVLCSQLVVNPKEKEVIKVPTKGKEVTKQEYQDIVNKKMLELRENFRSRNRGNGGGRGGRR